MPRKTDPQTAAAPGPASDAAEPPLQPDASAFSAPVVSDPIVPAPGVPVPTAAPPRGIRPRVVVVGAAAALAVILLAGGTSWIVARAAAAVPLPAATSAPDLKAGQHSGMTGSARAATAVRGTVSGMNGTTWTVTTAKGATVTVITTPTTRYLAAGVATSSNAFHVGDPVVVAGTRSGSTLTATRVVSRTPQPTSTPTA